MPDAAKQKDEQGFEAVQSCKKRLYNSCLKIQGIPAYKLTSLLP